MAELPTPGEPKVCFVEYRFVPLVDEDEPRAAVLLADLSSAARSTCGIHDDKTAPRGRLVTLGSTDGVSESGHAVRGYDVRSLGATLPEARPQGTTWSAIVRSGAERVQLTEETSQCNDRLWRSEWKTGWR